MLREAKEALAKQLRIPGVRGEPLFAIGDQFTAKAYVIWGDAIVEGPATYTIYDVYITRNSAQRIVIVRYAVRYTFRGLRHHEMVSESFIEANRDEGR